MPHIDVSVSVNYKMHWLVRPRTWLPLAIVLASIRVGNRLFMLNLFIGTPLLDPSRQLRVRVALPFRLWRQLFWRGAL